MANEQIEVAVLIHIGGSHGVRVVELRLPCDSRGRVKLPVFVGDPDTQQTILLAGGNKIDNAVAGEVRQDSSFSERDDGILQKGFVLKSVTVSSVDQIASSKDEFRLAVFVEIVNDQRTHAWIKFGVDFFCVDQKHFGERRFAGVIDNVRLDNPNGIGDAQAGTCLVCGPSDVEFALDRCAPVLGFVSCVYFK